MGSLCSPTTNTTQQSNSPPQPILDSYYNLINRAGNVASQPYTPYGGQIYAGMDPMTSQGIGNLYGVGAAATPYINAGYQAAGASAGPIAGQIAGFAQGNMDPYAAAAYRNGPQFQTFEQGLTAYQSPYTQQVIDATMAQMQHQDAIAQNGALGTAIKSGNAFGGDRMGVAAAELARGQGMNRASTIAGLQNQGFQQAVGQYNTNQGQALAGANLASDAYGRAQGLGLNALQGDQAAQARAAQLYGNLGQLSQNSALAGAQALIQGGQMYQQDAQNRINVPYQQWQQQQAFPYQQTSWLGNIITGTGSQAGGTGQTQSPGSSPLAQGVGLGATALGGLGMSGAFGAAGWLTPMLAGLKRGGPVGFAGGGAIGPYQQPIDFSSNSMNLIIPETGPMPRGAGPPRAPQAAAAPDPAKEAAGAMGSLKGAFGSAGSNALPFGASVPDAMGATSVGGPQGFAPLNYSGNLGPLYAGGGFVPGYAEGGDVINPDDPWRMPDQQAIDDWRASTDFQLGHRDAPLTGEVLPPLPRAGVPLPMGGHGAPPATALAYDRPPPPPPTNFGLAGAGPIPVAPPPPQGGEPTPVNKPDPWQALMQAGLAMMASRNPSALGAIGEGGLAGLSNYGQQKAAYDKLDSNPTIDHSGPTMRVYYPSTKKWVDTGIPTISAAQAASNERLKEQHSESVAARREAQGETSAYRRDTLEQRRLEATAAERQHREKMQAEGYIVGSDGSLKIDPDGVKSPGYLEKAASAKDKEKPVIKTVKDAAGNETLVRITPDGKSKAIKADGIDSAEASNPFAPSGKQTEGQANAGLYAGRMFQAEEILRDPNVVAAATSAPQRGLSMLPGTGKFHNQTSVEYQKFDQAQRNFINAVLRRESGAVISEQEFENARQQYFPSPGDSSERLAQKRANRQEAITGISAAAGPAWRAPATFDDEGNLVKRGKAGGGGPAPKATAKSTTIQPPANPKTGDRFQFKQGWGVWNGKQWVPE